MTVALWNLVAYGLQLAALVTVAFTAAWMLRIRSPRHSLRFWQTVLAIALLAPLAAQRGSATPDELSSFLRFTTAAAIPQSGGSAGLDAASVVLSIVAAGIVARLLWLGLGLIKLRSIVRRATADDSLAATTSDLTDHLGARAAVRITDDLEGPATVGVRHPIVLIPRSVLGMSAAVQRAIICHELLHVKRRDWLQTIGEEIWRSVLWFHPHAHVMASQLSLARETVVDEQTILITRDRRAYAEALLAFSDPQPHIIGVTPFIGRRTLSRRISLLAEEVAMSHHRAVASAAIALAASIAITAAAIDRFPMFATVQAQSVVYKPGDGVTLPKVLKEVKPSYTKAATDKKIQGSVWLQCVVGEDGTVGEITVTRSLDTEFGLDQEAIKAARQWRFEPARKDGKAVAFRITLELTFTLQ